MKIANIIAFIFIFLLIQCLDVTYKETYKYEMKKITYRQIMTV